jgi:hypothetical protein
MDEEQLKAECTEVKNELALIALVTYKIMAAFFSQSWNIVIQTFEKSKGLMKQNRVVFSYAMTMTHVGVAYLVQARKDRRFDRQMKAKRILNRVKVLGMKGYDDAIPYTKMMEAEVSCKSKSPTIIIAAFEEAIAAFRERHMIHDEAFACERAATVLLEMKEDNAGRGYLVRARGLYSRWKAQNKVLEMDGLLSAIVLP